MIAKIVGLSLLAFFGITFVYSVIYTKKYLLSLLYALIFFIILFFYPKIFLKNSNANSKGPSIDSPSATDLQESSQEKKSNKNSGALTHSQKSTPPNPNPKQSKNTEIDKKNATPTKTSPPTNTPLGYREKLEIIIESASQPNATTILRVGVEKYMAKIEAHIEEFGKLNSVAIYLKKNGQIQEAKKVLDKADALLEKNLKATIDELFKLVPQKYIQN